MAQIRCSDTKPEEKVRKHLFSQGYRYRKNVKNMSGKPDILLKKYKTIIFINGCFWHNHNCGKMRMPKSNMDYWESKLIQNEIRDKKNISALEKEGWKVLVVWECELSKHKFAKTMEDLEKNILSHDIQR